MGRCRFCGQRAKIVTRKLGSGFDETDTRFIDRALIFAGVSQAPEALAERFILEMKSAGRLVCVHEQPGFARHYGEARRCAEEGFLQFRGDA